MAGRNRYRNWLLVLILGAIVAGCASTRLTSSWQDPKDAGQPLTKVMVFGVTRQTTTRRIFEDEFVRQLQAKGLQAVASYTLIPEDGEVPQTRLQQAIDESGVNGLLVTRLVKVDKETQIYPGSYVGPPYYGFYGFYSSAWMGFYEPPQVYTYDVVTAETNLFRTNPDHVIWSGTTETFSPRDVTKDTREFAEIIIKALSAKKLI